MNSSGNAGGAIKEGANPLAMKSRAWL
ncbi:uncharacterized protein METZ01_LOCUS231001 [marine metagenome]|uniref:Uncharacterized protein n=1 Tax=marine metagenome TaxID=408172 RepID=A0A382GTX3_9ZZZZ